MTNSGRRAGGAAAFAVVIAACGGIIGCSGGDGSASTDASSSGTGGGGGSGGSSSSGGQTARVHGHVIFDSLNGQRNIPARSAPIGVKGGPSTMTDAEGAFALDLPTGDGVLLHVELDGEISVQRLVDVPAKGLEVEIHMIDVDAYAGATSELEIERTTANVGLAVRFEPSATAGYGAVLTPPAKASFAFNENFFAVQTKTTRKPDDSIYYINVKGNAVSLELTAPAGGKPCRDTYAPSATSYPLTSDTLTEIVVSCD